MSCNVERFVFLRTHARFQIAVAKFEVNVKYDEVKTTTIWNRAARIYNILKLKEFLIRYGFIIFVYFTKYD